MDPMVREGRLLTIDEYAELPDDGWRTELVRGRVVREPQPSYQHGSVQARIIFLLGRYLETHALDLTCSGPFGVITEEGPDTVRGPDLSIFRKERLADLHRAGFLRGAPELAVEVVSPSNKAGEIQEKVLEYFTAGARLVWVVYPRRKTVAVHASSREARFYGEDDDLDGGDVLPGLRVPVSELFRA